MVTFWKPKKIKRLKTVQSYWNNKSKVPIWKQKNDDNKLGKAYTRNQEILQHEEAYPEEVIKKVKEDRREEIKERTKLAKQGKLTWDMI